ncbi:hypothetical protein MRB53_030996 [Persea americana]|uniref:Uncharacterized protein n=1 Tax=Persea americana TaxID=3435 RepID=A0ACC2KMV0_PERAE|nr:hypothetical protein MRB53_030996 [Persea americana]
MFKTNAFWRGDERMLRRSHYMGGGNAAFTALPLLVLAVKRQFPLFLLSERRKSGICSFTADSFGVFPRIRTVTNSNLVGTDFTSLEVKFKRSGSSMFKTNAFWRGDERMLRRSHYMGGGNAAFTALPLPVLAVKRQFPLFLLSERRKSGICSFTADSFGGKPAPSAAMLFFAFFSF